MKKIFIVEDDINILYGLRDIFSSNDYEVILSDASEGLEELLSKIQKFKPNVVILDLVLPKVEGLEVLKQIKENDDTRDADVFIFTDLSDEDGRARSVGLGANYYFVKSEFDIYTFANKVMRSIERGDKTVEEEEDEESSDLVMD